MTLATISILLIVAVPLLVLVVDVSRIAMGHREPGAAGPIAVTAPAATPPGPSASRFARTPSAARDETRPPAGAIRPGEGMVYRAPHGD